MHGLLFRNQSALEHADLRRHTTELGIDVLRFGRDRSRGAVLARVRRDLHGGTASGAVRGTSTLFIEGSHSTGSYDVDALLEALIA